MDINIVNINEFDIKKLTLSKSFFTGPNKKKISIGYDTYMDCHILTPLFTNQMDFLLNHKYQYLKLIFDPMLGDLLKFYNIIESIESHIKHHIQKHNDKYSIQSLIKYDQTDLFVDDDNDDIDINTIKYTHLKLFGSNLGFAKNEPTYKIYDSNSTECGLNNLKNGWKFKTLIKFDSIWIDTTKKRFGINLELVQLKILQPVSQTKCLIDNDILISKKETYRYSNNTVSYSNSSISNIPDISIPPPLSSSSTGSSSGSNNNIGTLFKPPNPMELLSMKNALKKVLE
jgi:hypothetical protein